MQAQQVPLEARNIQNLLGIFRGWSQTNAGRFTPQLLEAISKSLAIAPVNRPLAPAYASAQRLRDALEVMQGVEITARTETEHFRNVVADHDFIINVGGEIPDDLRQLVSFLVRCLVIFNHARVTGALGDLTQKKFQFRFGTWTSNMYFINSLGELQAVLFDAFAKYNEFVEVFGNEVYHDDEAQGAPAAQGIRELQNEFDFLNEELQDAHGPERDALLIQRERAMNLLDQARENFDVAPHADDEREVITVSATYLRFLARRGARIPTGLKLPKEISRSVISPQWDDHYCFFSCLEIADVYFSKKYDKFCYYADDEKNPQLQEWSVSIEDIDRFYKDEVFKWSTQNLKQIEEWYGYNINVYDLTPGFGIRCCYRSQFQQEGERVVRILYVPYSMMEVDTKVVRGTKKQAQLVEDYNLGTEIVEYTNKADGHFVLIPETSRLLCEDGEEVNQVRYCPYCDSGFDHQGTKEETTLFKLHKEGCRNFVSNKSNEERLCKFTDNEENASKEFSNWYQLTKQPWIVYADTETQTCEGGTFKKHDVIAYMLNVVCNFNPDLSYQVIRIAKNQQDIGVGLTEQFANDIFQMRCYISEHSGKFPRLDHNVKKYWYRDFYRKERAPEDSLCGFCKCELAIDFEKSQQEFIEEMEDNDQEQENQANLWREYHAAKAGGRDGVKKPEEKPEEEQAPHLHHCHNTGDIVGLLCQRCNKNERKSQQIVSVAFHNLPYDLLVLIKSFSENTFSGIKYRGREFDDVTVSNDLEVIAQSGQKYSTVTIKRCKATFGRFAPVYLPAVKFIDTFRFITKSLGTIVETMKDNEKSVEVLKGKFPHTWQYLAATYGEEFGNKLFPWATQKGLIAYDHINLENLESKDNLPLRCYDNSLAMVLPGKATSRDAKYKKAEISKMIALKKDYARTNEVYEVLRGYHGEKMCYREYFRFYLELDIMLLTDYYESLRNQLVTTHRIDPAYHQGLASYSQNCMLYFTRSQLHLIQPVDVSKLIIDNCRGGFSGVMKRVSENYDSDPQKVIKYWDANNLYGYGLIQKLANKFVGEIDVDTFLDGECDTWSRDGDFAYFVLVDYKVPRELHDKFAKFAPLISKKSVKAEEVSFENRLLKEIRATEAGTKLCSTLEDGENYLMDWENFLFYERMGYDMTVKRVFKFEQEPILKSYIDMNSLLRQKSTVAIFKQLYKDLNNICYGKSLQNPMKYGNVELITSEKVLQNRIRNPLLKRCEVIVDDKLVLTDLYQDTMKFDTCIQYGFHVLEKSKLLMYTTLYEKIVPFCERHNVKWELLVHDTDSLGFEFGLHDSPFANEKEFMLALHKEENDVFDMHVYTDPELKDGSRKKVVGYFLDEYSDNYEIVGFVGLAAKSYCYVLKDVRVRDEKGEVITQIYKDDEEMHNMMFGETVTKIKGKGMRNSYLEALFDYRDFKKISTTGQLDDNNVTFRNIVKKDFGNTIATIDKVALSSYDDKWYIYHEDGETKYLPYGHYKIAEM